MRFNWIIKANNGESYTPLSCVEIKATPRAVRSWLCRNMPKFERAAWYYLSPEAWRSGLRLELWRVDDGVKIASGAVYASPA